VLREFLHRLGRMQIPDIELIVIPSRGQLTVIKRPLQPTHLLPMPLQFLQARFPYPDIP
jgi:hypothetical protein